MYRIHHYHSLINHSVGSSGATSFWGAFGGSFFAFIFGLITYMITKRRERFVIHKNALVKLDKALNKQLNDLYTLKKIAENASVILAGNKVSSNRLFELKIPENVETEIGSIDLANKLLSYEIVIDRLNFNAKTINHALTRIEDLFINGQPVAAANFSFISGTLNSFVAELPQVTEMVTKFLLIIRIHEKRLKGKNSFISGIAHSHWEQNISADETKKEKDKYEDEIKKPASTAPDDIF